MISIKNVFFRTTICSVSVATTIILILVKWKKKIVIANRKHCGFNKHNTVFRYKLYFNLSLDFWVFVFGVFPGEINISSEVKVVLDKMKASGGVLLSFHYSNYELLAQKISEHTGNMYGAYEPLRNPFANNLLSKIRNRKNQYVKIFYGKPWDVFELVNGGGVFGFMVDQSFASHTSTEMFFGKGCAYLNLPNLVQKKCRVPGYVCSIKRMGLIRYTIHCSEISPGSQVNGFANTTLESLVRDKPELWYGWFHRRFKSIDPTIYS